jgi:peptidyl-tRNA hydrolase, PTH1 family
MWLIVGLGNPGPKYALTRHNLGFLAVDLFSQSAGKPPWSEEQKAHVCKFKMDDVQIILAKPMTFMNKSGESVQALLHYYKIPTDNLLVVHDEVEIPFGQIRLQKNRGAGGHNGVKSVNEMLGTQDYLRLRLGVGRPPHPEMDVADYVLQKFNGEEQDKLTEFLNRCGDAMESLIFDGLNKAATRFNS